MTCGNTYMAAQEQDMPTRMFHSRASQLIYGRESAPLTAPYTALQAALQAAVGSTLGIHIHMIKHSRAQLERWRSGLCIAQWPPQASPSLAEEGRLASPPQLTVMAERLAPVGVGCVRSSRRSRSER